VFSFAAEQKLIHHYDDAKSLEQQQLFKHHLGVAAIHGECFLSFLIVVVVVLAE
jgi:hypothetical protein